MKLKSKRKELIYWAVLLNQKGFVTARSGNISLKVAKDKILITSHDSYLGYLREDEILLVNLEGEILEGEKEITSEKKLHLDIHKKFKDINVILHAHPPFTIAFFHYFDKLDIFSFEAKFYLGSIKVIPQDTPIVIDTAPILEALDTSNIVVLKNHGIISVGKKFKEAFSLIELLEEQAKVNILMKDKGYYIGEDIEDTPEVKKLLQQSESKRFKLLSKEHIDRLIELVNSDEEAQTLGRKYDLTCTLAVKNQDTNDTVRFHYKQGKIIKVDNNDNAEFVIIGKTEILKKIFNREIDPFVASTQGKVKTKGDFSKMSRWYPVLVRTFKLWEEAPVE